VYLVPDIDPRSSICRLPFSAQFMLQAFSRCQKRDSHFTLDNSDPVKLVEIQTMFMLLNKDVQFDEDFADSIGFDDYLRLPMSNEQIAIPDDLLDTLTKVLLNFRGVGKSNPGLVSSFIEMLKKYDSLLSKQVDTRKIVNAFVEQLDIRPSDSKPVKQPSVQKKPVQKVISEPAPKNNIWQKFDLGEKS
jgi:hypothetical protein